MRESFSCHTVYMDTALSALYLCVERNDGEKAEYNAGELRSSDSLHKILLGLLEDLALKIEDIGALVFVRGPGSFTGLRIAYAFAEALKMSCENINISAVDALEAALKSYKHHINDDVMNVLLNAHGSQAFHQKFKKESNEEDWKPLSQPISVPFVDVKFSEGEGYLLGMGVEISFEDFEEISGINSDGMKNSQKHMDYAPVYVKPLNYRKIESD